MPELRRGSLPNYGSIPIRSSVPGLPMVWEGKTPSLIFWRVWCGISVDRTCIIFQRPINRTVFSYIISGVNWRKSVVWFAPHFFPKIAHHTSFQKKCGVVNDESLQFKRSVLV